MLLMLAEQEPNGPMWSLFQHSYERFQRKIFAFLFRRLGGNREDAEELTQEVFLVFYKHLEAGEVYALQDVDVWLFQVARNLVANYRRKTQRRARAFLALQSFVDWISSWNVSQQEMELIAQRRDLFQSLQQLTDEEQDLIAMAAEGYSGKEMGRLLNEAPKNVRSQLSRARKKLRLLLQDGGGA